jgi:hypothetical protein
MVDRGSFSDMRHLGFVDDCIRSYAPVDAKISLPDDWVPSPWSVICGRGKECFDHGKSNTPSQKTILYDYTVDCFTLDCLQRPSQTNNYRTKRTHVSYEHSYSYQLQLATEDSEF